MEHAIGFWKTSSTFIDHVQHSFTSSGLISELSRMPWLLDELSTIFKSARLSRNLLRLAIWTRYTTTSKQVVR